MFEGKTEPRYEPYTKSFRGRGNLGKICKCVYDGGFEAFGNGKLEKQAKLVAAWNMIERLKKENIGIVNETLATGIVVDKSVLKKPVAGQFTSFKKAGTLSSSFVSASSSSSTPAKLETAVVVESVAERLAKEAQREVDEYQRSLLEGDKQSDVIHGPVKRSHDDMACSERLHNPKVAKASGRAGNVQSVIGTVTSPANSIGPQVIPKHHNQKQRERLRAPQFQNLVTTGVGQLTGEVNKGVAEEGEDPLGQAQGLEIGHVQHVEITTSHGGPFATSAPTINKQTQCQLPILVGDIIQAMEMATARSLPASKCYLVCVL